MRNTLPEKLEAGRVRVGSYASDPSLGPYGLFHVQGPCGERLTIIASGADEKISQGWEHVSISTKRRTPNWREMAFVKDLFWDDEDCVVQFHPPKFEYVNNHPYCLHLWKPPYEVKLPPAILIGVKEVGELKSARDVDLCEALVVAACDAIENDKEPLTIDRLDSILAHVLVNIEPTVSEA